MGCKDFASIATKGLDVANAVRDAADGNTPVLLG